jgi:hypothetical protein
MIEGFLGGLIGSMVGFFGLAGFVSFSSRRQATREAAQMREAEERVKSVILQEALRLRDAESTQTAPAEVN